MKPSLGRACVGGFVATTLMTMMVFFVSPYMTGGPSDLAGVLVGLVGGSWIVGLIVHYLLGTLVLPAVYVGLVYRRLVGGPMLRGLLWGVILWVLSHALIIPATGGGVFGGGMGGLRVVIDSLIGHLVYGLVFGVWTGAAAAAVAGARAAPGTQR